MRNMLALVAAAALTFVGAGWYLGWYRVESAPAPEGHRAVHIDIDSEKISTDLKKGGEKVQGAIDSKMNGTTNSTRSSENTPPEPPTSDE